MPFNFDPKKPFYSLVLVWYSAIYGFKELAGRGASAVFRRQGQAPAMLANLDQVKADCQDPGMQDPKFWDRVRESLSVGSEIMPPVALIRTHGPPLAMDADEMGEELSDRSGGHAIGQFIHLAGIILIAAHEITESFRDRGPLWEFLRHCRNAAAHGGSFDFHPGQPRHHAQWQTLQITRALQGSALFKTQTGTGPGLLMVGDAIELLWDIEQANPGIQ